MHLLAAALEEKRTLIYKLMTGGVKIQKCITKKLRLQGGAYFSQRKYKGNIRNEQGGGTAYTGAQGSHQSLNSTNRKAPDRNPIHVVKPRVLTNGKPHQRSGRSRYRAGGRRVSGVEEQRMHGMTTERKRRRVWGGGDSWVVDRYECTSYVP